MSVKLLKDEASTKAECDALTDAEVVASAGDSSAAAVLVDTELAAGVDVTSQAISISAELQHDKTSSVAAGKAVPEIISEASGCSCVFSDGLCVGLIYFSIASLSRFSCSILIFRFLRKAAPLSFILFIFLNSQNNFENDAKQKFNK